MKIAAWQYPIEAVGTIDVWRDKLAAGVEEAAAGGATILVVPEYASMELTSVLSTAEQASLAAQLGGLQRLLVEYHAAYRELAMKHRISIVGGSIPMRDDDESFRNRLRVYGIDGEFVPVEKLQMTRFEREVWGISGAVDQTVIDLGDGVRLGVAICYDSEFPNIVRRLAYNGANVIAVPSCTDAPAGYYRVRVACQARALENQCYVVQAPTVGDAPWSIAVDANRGAAAVYGPSDRGFPDDGIVAMGVRDVPHMLIAELDLALVDAARADGLVLGYQDWNRPIHHGGHVGRAKLG